MPKPPVWRGVALALLALALGAGSARGAQSLPKLIEPDTFAAAIAAGRLPEIKDRIPKTPLVVNLKSKDKQPGRYGGTLHILGGRNKDTRLMVVFGYARLVVYNEAYQLVPDIAERVDVKDGRIFTFHLRKGQRWSDGYPFTAEDFRYYWEDVATNKDLSVMGVPRELLVDGERPHVDIVNATTVRYSWTKPNPFFLPALARAQPLYIYRPAHYLKQFHAKYANPAELRRKVKAAGVRNWVALHYAHDHPYKNNNPDYPTLQPWVLKTQPPSSRYVFVRNPYFHRLDSQGRQLPYIDKVVMTIVTPKLIPAITGSGESDLQARYLDFSNYTFLKQDEKRNGFTVRRWTSAKGARIALYPNLNVKDAQWRALMRNVKFRRALSLAINRRDIDLAVYYGLARDGNNTVLPQSPLYKAEYTTRWARYDPQQANALLDKLGLKRRNAQGIRRLHNGRELAIIIETAGENTEQTDVLGLIRDDWRKIGVKVYIKPMQREVFRRRIFAGSTLMSVWTGLDNAIPTANQSPGELAPISQQQLQWPQWGQYFETMGRSGVPPDLPQARRLLALYRAWSVASDHETKRRIWTRMLKIQADQVFTIGVISDVPQLVVVNNRLRNVPRKGVYSWNPGALFGVYRPETFWFADTADKQGSKKR